MKSIRAKRENFWITPRIVRLLNLSDGAFRLYCELLDETHDGENPFTQDGQTAGRTFRMSEAKFRRLKHELAKPFPLLNGKSLVTIHKVRSRTNPSRFVDHLQIVDIWPEHRRHYERRDASRRPAPNRQGLVDLGYDETEADLIDFFNQHLVPIGYLPVTAFTQTVCDALNGIDESDLREIVEEAEQEGTAPKGDATLVRLLRTRAP